MASDYYRVPDWETRLRTVTHAFGLVVGAIVLGLVGASFAVQLLALFGVRIESVETAAPLPYAVLNAAQFVGYYAAGLLYLNWQGFPDLFRVGLPSLRDLAWVVGGFVALYLLAAGLTVAFEALGVESATNSVVEQGRQDPVRFLYLIPVTFLFVAPGEELVFRGVIQGIFREAYGVVPAVVFASAIFGFGHWLALLGSSTGKIRYVVVAAAPHAALVLLDLASFPERVRVLPVAGFVREDVRLAPLSDGFVEQGPREVVDGVVEHLALHRVFEQCRSTVVRNDPVIPEKQGQIRVV